MQPLHSSILVVALCGVLTFGVRSCDGANPANSSDQPARPLPTVQGLSALDTAPTTAPMQTGEIPMDTRLAAADNQFGFDLFNQLLKQDQSKNVFFSPISIAFALAMTYNGAAGETRDAMTRVLRLKGMSLDEVNQASAALTKTLKSADPQIELAIANSLWARQGVKFNETFLARNRQYFNAEVASIDFTSPQAAGTINAWVNKNTKGKIPAIVDRIDAQVLFLVNAVYFKGQWQKKFDKAQTQDQPFHLASGAQKQIPLMSQTGSYLYLRGEKFQAVSLPYGNGGTSLCLFLPDEGASLNDFLKGLTYERWEQWIKSLRKTPGTVKLPRFKLDYDRNLNETLKALGLGVAFTDNADFSGMRAERDLKISEVKHKAIVEVNEEGTEAAAATSVGMRTTSMRPVQEPFTFIADRPFLMAIRHQDTGTILFLGTVMEPK